MSQDDVKSVCCPACATPVKWLPENRYRPFCSARCKGIDLGAWASGNYLIAGSIDADEHLGDDALVS